MRTSFQTAALAGLWATSTLAQEESSDCVEGLHIIIARGTTEPQGPGDTGRVVERVLERIEDSSFESVVYPATYTDPYHVDSIKNGSDAARKAIADYAEKCPDGKIALFGYSQGAQVMGNALCGDRTGWLNDTVISDNLIFQLLIGDQEGNFEFESGPALDEEIVSGNVVSVVLFGDPTFGENATFTEGTATSDGFWPRDWASCDQIDSLTRSYCREGDIICDASSEYVDSVHTEYVHTDGVDAVEFVLEKWNEATGADVEVEGGDEFETFDEGSSGTEPTDTEDDDDAAAGLNAAGSLLVGGPLIALAGLLLA